MRYISLCYRWRNWRLRGFPYFTQDHRAAKKQKDGGQKLWAPRACSLSLETRDTVKNLFPTQHKDCCTNKKLATITDNAQSKANSKSFPLDKLENKGTLQNTMNWLNKQNLNTPLPKMVIDWIRKEVNDQGEKTYKTTKVKLTSLICKQLMKAKKIRRQNKVKIAHKIPRHIF